MKLTSKDVLASLSEARADHMRQLLSNVDATSSSSREHNLTDLYKSCNTPHTDGDHIDISQQQYPRTWRWLWCTCCLNQRVTYSEAVQGISSMEHPLSSRTSKEESTFLLDSDELGLTWENDGENR